MATYFVNREVVARADLTFSLDVPAEIESLGNSAIKSYIKEKSYWRNDAEIEIDIVIFEKDSE